MPKYTFLCESCKREFDYFVLLSDEKVVCPNCKEKDMTKFKKLISAGTSFVLKGKGWYKDGY